MEIPQKWHFTFGLDYTFLWVLKKVDTPICEVKLVNMKESNLSKSGSGHFMDTVP